MSRTTGMDLESQFADAWDDPRNTRFELPAVDVNRVLQERYTTGEPLTFTRTMLWDNEVRKAWSPGNYLRYVVREGSAASWRRQQVADGAEYFVRRSRQRQWLDPERYGLVLERTYLNQHKQVVTFLGAAELVDEAGTVLHTDPSQALFHVEHAVGGEENRPLNLWRIVHLTDQPDDRIVQVFSHLAANEWLPEFIEIYIREDLNIELERNVTLLR